MFSISYLICFPLQRGPPPPPLPLPVNIPTSAMAAIVHPAFGQLSGSNMLPPGVVSPQYAQPFIYQTHMPGMPTGLPTGLPPGLPGLPTGLPTGIPTSLATSQMPKLPTSQAGLPPGQAFFLPSTPFVIPAAHLYPQLYGQPPPVQVPQKTEK